MSSSISGTGFKSKPAPKPEIREYVLPGAGEAAPKTKILHDCKNTLLAESTSKEFVRREQPKVDDRKRAKLSSLKETIPVE